MKLQIFCSWALNNILLLLRLQNIVLAHLFVACLGSLVVSIFLFKSIKTSNGNYRLNKTLPNSQVSDILLDIRLDCNGHYLYVYGAYKCFHFAFAKRAKNCLVEY